MSELSAPASEKPTGGGLLHRLRFLLPLLITILLVDSAYLFIANRASGPPRIELSAFLYEGLLLLHLALGLGALVYSVVRLGKYLKSVGEAKGMGKVWGILLLLSLVVCFVTGLGFMGIGFQVVKMGLRMPLRFAHDVGTGGVLLFGLFWLMSRARRKEAEDAPERIAHLRMAWRSGLLLGTPLLALLLWTIYAPNTTDRRIVNPALPPMTPFNEGDGEKGHFFPASVQTVDNVFFPPEYYTDSQSCGEAGCHPDVYKQWNESAHHLSSFNNQYYRKSIELMQEAVGTQPSKWCGGCHDMAVLQTEDPQNPGHPRFDRPIKDQVWPPEKFPTSHAGIGCAACHSVVHVKSTMGVSDFTADYPPMHKYLTTNVPMMKSVHKFLTRLAPEPHKKTFLRPFHRDQTAKFCSSCHKVHLDKPVNGYRWLRGQNEYDAWQGSGVSGFGAVSFYYPADEKTGQPAFKKCADCHMPKVPSNDAGSKDGLIKSHRFPGGNTALPLTYGFHDQIAETQKFLQDKALSIDIFGIKREVASAKPAAQGSTPNAQRPMGETVKAGSFSANTNVTDITAATNVPETELSAPINRGGKGIALRRGEAPLIEVVVRTKKLGHAFPGGTIDAFDCWVELEGKDETGKTFFHSGKLQWKDGPVDEAAEKYRTLVVDQHAKKIDKRNVWAIRSAVYTKTIPPGAADTVHYRLKVPATLAGKKVTLTAKLNYRKFDWWFNFFTFAGRPVNDPALIKTGIQPGGIGLGVGKTGGIIGHGWDDREIVFDADLSTISGNIKGVPVQPITVLAQDTVEIPLVGANDKLESPVVAGDPKIEQIRWNDYGIGLLLQGDLKAAVRAFTQVTQVSPKWSEGYVNIGRVRQVERNTPEAMKAFEQAFALYDAKPTPMTPYQKARTQNFYAQALFDQGRIDEALKTLEAVRTIFPDDRGVRNLTGAILFRAGRYDEAVVQFRHSLTVEPEDIMAHYNLMKCFKAKGDKETAAIHESLYKRFKADETNTKLSGEYRRVNVQDNNLAQPIHEIGDAVMRPKPKWLIEFEKKQDAKQNGQQIGKQATPKSTGKIAQVFPTK